MSFRGAPGKAGATRNLVIPFLEKRDSYWLSNNYVTVKAAVAKCVKLPLTPVTVTVQVPVGVFGEVEIVSVALPEPVMVVELRLELVRLGKPVTQYAPVSGMLKGEANGHPKTIQAACGRL